MNYKNISSLIFLLCLVCLNFTDAAAQATSANRPTAVIVSGQVGHQQSNTMLEGVTLTLNGGSVNLTAATDSSGKYSFGAVPAGQYTLSAFKAGYQFFPPAVSGDMASDQWREFTASGPMPNLAPAPTPGAPVKAWASFYDGPNSFNDINPMMTLDAEGNVLVAAASYNVADRYGDKDIAVMKYDRGGNLLWTRRFDGPGHGQDDPADIKTDAQGNVYVTGSVWAGDEPDFDFVTIKYDAGGNQLWFKYYNGTADYQDMPHALRLDAAGSVYVAGYSIGSNNGRIDNNFATIKYDTNGVQLWKKEFDGGLDDGAEELELDAQGNVYVTGTSHVNNGGSTSDIITVKYNTDGAQQWVNRYDSRSLSDDTAMRLQLDASGNIYVLGKIWIRQSQEVVLIKISGTSGANVWTRNWSNSNGVYQDRPLALAIDAGGNPIISGQTYYSTSDQNVDAFTVKFNPSGAVLWKKIFNGPSTNGFDGDNQLTVDAGGNIYVGLSSQGFNNYDLTLVKYSPDGTQSYSYRFDNPEHRDDLFWGFENTPRGSSMMTDAQGNIYMVGDSTRFSTVTNAPTIDISAVKLSAASLRRAAGDFDGDGRSDIGVYRQTTGEWWLNRSSAGSIVYQFGSGSDVIAPADFTGDGKTDVAFFRQSTGEWFIMRSENNSFYAFAFGTNGDIAAPGDYDGDGRADAAVFRPSNATWYISKSSGGTTITQFGSSIDKPVAADYDGDGKTDLAVYRTASGEWWINKSAGNTVVFQFGTATDKAVPADYTGDGKTDVAFFRPTTGEWFVLRSENQSYYSFAFGQNGDIPVAGDYDGDGKADTGVFRSGAWFISGSAAGVTVQTYGSNTDKPILSVD